MPSWKLSHGKTCGKLDWEETALLPTLLVLGCCLESIIKRANSLFFLVETPYSPQETPFNLRADTLTLKQSDMPLH